ncbi:MAG: preprotein translocase subunit SecA [Candidatus Kapabacteria bacterium]|jgi:preprotein translocase subunit SecA|nr:preprotein translocase subunit SecA [Candidatus Kapabacteria bacterium]
MLNNLLKSIFGSKHDKDVKEIRPLVDTINGIYETLSSLSDEDLRARTDMFRARVQDSVQDLLAEVASIREQLQTDDEMTHADRANAYARLSQLDREQFETIQATLDELLPEAFATVKEACRRLVGHEYLVAGSPTRWDMIPYDVQLIGGIVLHQGKISEMATGEGKTLVATLPLYLNALSGRGVHLVTVNDYLARRDREWMQPIFDMLGVSTGCIQSNLQPHQRQVEYAKDITYGTNNEFGFDYLRDNMVTQADHMVQRPHWFAVVDEVDSVLIDEARTPLIISGPVQSASNDQAFNDLNPRVRRMVDVQSRLINTLVADAERLLKSEVKEDRTKAGVNLLMAHRGMPKHNRLAKLLQDPSALKLLRDTELDHLKEQGQRMHLIDDELYFSVDEKNHQIDISEKGRELLASDGTDPDMFIIPDIATEMSALVGDTSLSDNELQLRKDQLMLIYADRSDRIHVINQLLRAYTLYVRDDEYVVQDGKVKIVDEFTGRILEGRRYSDGLHQAIEAKEGVHVEEDTQTFATITLQNYFRLYHKLAGMTGTAETESAEFYEIYKLDVVVIPTNRPIQRKDLDDLIYRTKLDKYNAVTLAVKAHLEEGRAVLVGTTSVEVSEILSKMFKRASIVHNVLNAKQHQREAEIVAQAGRKGAVTIATNMAGRGTDIKLDPEVKANGGLAIIGTERHESRRIDRQLRGRAGRQGDPGSSQFFISLEDDLMRLFGGERIAAIMQTMKVPDGEPIQHSMVTKSVTNAQKKVEANNFSIRKRLLEYDNVMNQQREVVYDRRRHALMGDRLKADLYEYVMELAGTWYDEYHDGGDVELLKIQCRSTLLCEPDIADDAAFKAASREDVIEKILAAASEFYDRKEERLGHEMMIAIERYAALESIDDLWREHLRGMDDLKEGIYLRSYGQKDPLLEYKQEAYKMFVGLVADINKQTTHTAFKLFPRVAEQPQERQRVAAAPTAAPLPSPKVSTSISASRALTFSHPTASVYSGTPTGEAPAPEQKASTTVRTEGTKLGPNDACPLDPAKKFKYCCGAQGHKTCQNVLS